MMLGRQISAFAFGAVLLLNLTDVNATPITLTGSELFSAPNVAFPTIQPTLDNSSLVFAPQIGRDNSKLIVAPLFSAGAFPGGVLSLSVNLTRLPCIGDVCGSTPVDFDPHLLIGDGTNLVGAAIGDNNGGEFLGASLDDAGTTGANRDLLSIFTGASFPDFGEAIEITLFFEFDDLSTTVSGSFLNGSGTFISTNRVIDPLAALSFVFMSDNDEGEQYQLNSLTIPNSSVAEPGTFALLGVCLAGLGFIRGRRWLD